MSEIENRQLDKEILHPKNPDTSAPNSSIQFYYSILHTNALVINIGKFILKYVSSVCRVKIL